MMQGSIDISELYDSGTISGETYLYCVEHGVSLVQDILCLTYADASNLVSSELNEIKAFFPETESANEVTEPDDSGTGMTKEIDSYYSFIQSRLTYLDADTLSYFRMFEERYSDKVSLVQQILFLNDREQLPVGLPSSEEIVNAFLDFVYDIQTYGKKYSIYDEVFRLCNDIRSCNILKSKFEYFGNKLEFVTWLLRCDRAEVIRLKNCGSKSYSIIWGIIKRLRIISEEKQDLREELTDEKTALTAEDSVALFKGIIDSRRQGLSVRANHVLSMILSDRYDSYADLLKLFQTPKISFLDYRNCGRNTDKELRCFKDEVLRALNSTSSIESVNDVPKVDVQDDYSLENSICHNKSLQFIEYLVESFIDGFPYSSRMVFTYMFEENNHNVCRFCKDLFKATRPIYRFVNKRHKGVASLDDINSLKDKLLDVYNEYHQVIELVYLSSYSNVKVYAILRGWLAGCGNMSEFIDKLISYDKNNLPELPNATAKTIYKILNIAQDVKALLSGSVQSCDAENRAENAKIAKWVSLLKLPLKDVQDINAVAQSIGRFPLFLAIQKYIENLTYRDSVIFLGQVDIYQDQELKNRSDIGRELNVSGERVRQLRGSIFNKLSKYVVSLQKMDIITYELKSSVDDVNYINYQEHTNFQDNFIYWVLSLCNKSRWTIIGDIEDTFFNPHGHQVNLNIVSTELFNSYNFSAFVEEFRRLYIRKRTVEEELNLQSFCMHFYRGAFQLALFDDIIYECKKIILRLFNCVSRGDLIILEGNSYRGLPEVVEEILENRGAPMTTEEIYNVLKTHYPEKKCANLQSCKIHISKNKRIVNLEPVGRRALFALVEWDVGTKRNSSIKEIAEEFIFDAENNIVLFEDLCEYIKPYRPEASNASIRRTLISVNEGFSLYMKGERQYIGFSARLYPKEYVRIESLPAKRTIIESCKEIEEFVTRNGRFPFLGEEYSDDENRLYRFWQRVLKKKKDGLLIAEDLDEVTRIENSYELYNISRSEYNWREIYSAILNKLIRFGKDGLDSSEKSWCYKHIRQGRNNQLNAWQVPLIKRLESLYA